MRLAGLLCAAAFALGGCSWLDAINPFSGPAKPKLAPLAPITAPSADLRVVWQASIGKAGEYAFVPAVAGGSVYAAARDGTLARLDDGRQVWRIAAAKSLSGGVGADGKLVAVGSREGEVLAFDADGKPLWKARVSSEVLSAPLVTADLVIVRSGDQRIHALAAADGKRKWSYQRSTPPLTLRSFAGVAVRENAVVAGFPGGRLVALSLGNGGALWESTVALPKGATELERIADVTSTPLATARAVCAAAYQGRVACFDAAGGNGQWARDISSSAGVDSDGRYLYVTDEAGALHCLDLVSGASVWKQDKLAGRGTGRPLALAGYVAVGDAQGNVHLLKRDNGDFAARLATDGSALRADPVRMGDDRFLVQSSAGNLYALSVK